ncbi:hypothetical protein BGZ65_000825 [Modicella reniformis]|uniref:Rab-GAP TBC domain-containing protein n=1 Tax=Modicella reniformis TaxID=1440133 RepID=A0A9P6MJK5_9FUNG|nr:hypothetical protein BGZ65_000825 [Modicella reniformis]
MTTSSDSEPETETHQPSQLLMDTEASSPRPAVLPLSVLSPSNEPPTTDDDSRHIEGQRTPKNVPRVVSTISTISTTTTSSIITTGTIETTATTPSTPDDDSLSKVMGASSPSTDFVQGSMSARPQSAASYVHNGTHDSQTSEGDADGSRRTPHQQQWTAEETGIMGREKEEHENVTTSTSTPTDSLILEHDSTSVDVDMSMTTSARHTASIPPSVSSSVSTGLHMIAESSTVLNSVMGQPPSTIIHRGSLSSAWSTTSLPRDISALYSRDPANSAAATAVLMEERLYGLVDRYGFLVEEGRIPTGDRVNSRRSSLVSTSPAIFDARYQAKMIEKEQERSVKWARMASQYTSPAGETEYSFPNQSKFVSRVYKGIPDCWRAAAWSHLISKRSAGFEPNIRQIYYNMLDISSSEEEQIDLDIPRTMHGHIMFRRRYGPGQCALFKVLKAYSNYNNQVGYCQGMASVVATMLTFFDEEKTFVLLAQLFDRYGIKDVVVPGFPGLFETFYIQEELTKLFAPRVFEALKTMDIKTPTYASRWYITLFSAGVVPYRVLLRIWDIFLLEGFDWLYFVAIALLKYHEPTLVQNNFERTMEMLTAKMDIQDDDRLFKIARQLFKQARKSRVVEKLRASYTANPTQTSANTMAAPTAS